MRALVVGLLALTLGGCTSYYAYGVTPEQEAMTASYSAAELAVAKEIASRTGIAGTARWNDVAGRSQAEVMALVQDVATQEEAAGR